MVTRQNAIDISNRFIKELIENGIPLERAILFGSYANENQNKDSDIDIALFSKVFSGVGFIDKKLFAKWNIKPQYINIEVTTFGSQDQDPFIEIIENTGIQLYKAI